MFALRKPAVRQCASFHQSTYMATANGKSISPSVPVEIKAWVLTTREYDMQDTTQLLIPIMEFESVGMW